MLLKSNLWYNNSYFFTKYKDSSARSYTKICRLVIREYTLIKQREINFDSIVYTTYGKDMSYLHTHNTHTHK